MNQTGRVTAVDEQKTVISVIRETACGESCASCSAKCSLKNVEVTAKTIPGVKPGDTVEFEMPSSKVLFAAFLVYITPLLVLLASYLVAVALGATEGVAFITGICLTALWFTAVHFIDKKLRKHYRHIITKKTEGDF